MKRNLLLLICFIVSIGVYAMTREPPKRFTDRVSIAEENDLLVISIETVKDPASYTVYEIYIFGRSSDNQIILNSDDCITKNNVKYLDITITRWIKEFGITEVGVMLSRKGKMEYYSFTREHSE